ncbi:hypothetical protein U1Q18_027792, partial [Sarracenia purpurea var. burkii]
EKRAKLPKMQGSLWRIYHSAVRMSSRRQKQVFKHLLQHPYSVPEDVKLIMATTLAEMELMGHNITSLLEDGVLSSLLRLASCGGPEMKGVAAKARQNFPSLLKCGLQIRL